MKPQLITADQTLPADVPTKQSLYDSYAKLLFGYLLEAVKDNREAEEFLEDIFNDLQLAGIQAITRPGVNTFCQLQIMARRRLAAFTATIDECVDISAPPKKPRLNKNKFTQMMTPEQEQVFCGMHYHGKSTATLAAELGKSEDAVKIILKESFTIIRNRR